MLRGVVDTATLKQAAYLCAFETAGQQRLRFVQRSVRVIKLPLQTLCSGNLGQELSAVGSIAGRGQQSAESRFRFLGLVVVPELIEVEKLLFHIALCAARETPPVLPAPLLAADQIVVPGLHERDAAP